MEYACKRPKKDPVGERPKIQVKVDRPKFSRLAKLATQILINKRARQ